MELAGTTMAQALERVARGVRVTTLVALAVVATFAIAYGQFDRSWGVVPLTDGAAPASADVVVVGTSTTH